VKQKPVDLKLVEQIPVAFSDANIARLNAREAKRRRDFSNSQAELSKLSEECKATLIGIFVKPVGIDIYFRPPSRVNFLE
jgi:hypothetical protein